MIIRRDNTLRLLTQFQAQRTRPLNVRCTQQAPPSTCVSSPIHDDAQEAPLCHCLVSCRSGSSSVIIASEQILSSQLLINCVSSSLHILSHLIFKATIQDGYHCFLLFNERETHALNHLHYLPRLNRLSVIDLESKPRLLDFKVLILKCYDLFLLIA